MKNLFLFGVIFNIFGIGLVIAEERESGGRREPMALVVRIAEQGSAAFEQAARAVLTTETREYVANVIDGCSTTDRTSCLCVQYELRTDAESAPQRVRSKMNVLQASYNAANAYTLEMRLDCR